MAPVATMASAATSISAIALAAIAVATVTTVAVWGSSTARVAIAVAITVLGRAILERLIVCLDFLEKLITEFFSFRYTFGTRSTRIG
jgi:hypothetical protein